MFKLIGPIRKLRRKQSFVNTVPGCSFLNLLKNFFFKKVFITLHFVTWYSQNILDMKYLEFFLSENLGKILTKLSSYFIKIFRKKDIVESFVKMS